MRMRGGMRAFLRRGKFAPTHSELEDFLVGRITREQGMGHLREVVRPTARTAKKLRAETLEFLRAWDLVYLDRLAAGRLVPGEPTAASEALHNLNANEALLLLKAKSRRFVAALPPIIRRSLQARVKKMVAAWGKDGKQYDRLFAERRRPKPTPFQPQTGPFRPPRSEQVGTGPKVPSPKRKGKKKPRKAKARARKRKRY